MAIIKGKSNVSHKCQISLSIYYVRTAFPVFSFPSKRHESWTHVILLLGFGLVLSQISPSIHYVWRAIPVFCFPSKWHESWTHFILCFDFGFVNDETTKTHSYFHTSPQQ